MGYSKDVIEEIRQANDIVSVVSSYVVLKQASGTSVGLCPFHKEKTPSFNVSPSRQTYKCFGCGVAGNVITFIMQIENMAFLDALTMLANRANVTLPEQNMSEFSKVEAKLKETLFELHKVAARFYYDTLLSQNGEKALTYLESRGVSTSSQTKFGLGYANTTHDSLFNHLLAKGYDIDTILKSGLVLAGKNGGYYDRFFDRLMFPIFDILGRIVGFGGRDLGSAPAKYLNSPETMLFYKSKNLYAINFARKSNAKTYLLVEGYMDVIALHQAGFTNAVAALGTAFNAEHAKLLKSYANTVVLIFDGDEAGVKAALRAIPVLLSAGIETKVLTLQGAKDPDEFVQKFGAGAFDSVVRNAKGHIYYQIAQLEKNYDLNKTEDKLNFVAEVAKILSKLQSRVEREAYAQDIANMTNLSFDSIIEDVNKLLDQTIVDAKFSGKANAVLVSRNRMGEKGINEAKKGIINIMTENTFVCKVLKQHLQPSEMDDAVYGVLLEQMYSCFELDKTVLPAEMINCFETIEEQHKASDVFNSPIAMYEGVSVEKAVNEMVKTIKLNNINKSISDAKDTNELKLLIESKKNVDKLYIPLLDG